jgi:hypothetical protein
MRDLLYFIMNAPKPIGYYESLITQIEADYENLKRSFEKLKTNSNNKKLISELCQDYSFLLQDISYIESLNRNFHSIEFPIPVRVLKYLNKNVPILKEIEEFLFLFHK